ncbi:S-layer homology domain-containing protein [Sporosarcina sp. Sa2YVA2]|uniref:S-layer homology domain-containing protein n=1 Tax=Sporosarcina quadrami TaxID=2762234 RepID=A0ABR8U947_9BACL|nr:S-layer homology domain-containing protein [Sporosarcina quadrami]MBD7984566.1 S-layer homology domain-containing protein [Sporosarcina quadrami]
MKKVFKKVVIAIILVASLSVSGLSQVSAKDTAASFKDIKKSYVYYDVIQDLTGQGLINGYVDGTFRPGDDISIKHVGALVVRALDARGIQLPVVYDYELPFDSISKQDKEYANMIRLQKAGIPSFNAARDLNEKASRMDIAEILSMAFNLKSKADYLPYDVGPEAFFADHVKALYTNGITTTDETGNFNPYDKLTRAHFAVFLHRTLNMDENFKPVPVTKPKFKSIPKEAKVILETPHEKVYKYNKKIAGGGSIQKVIVNKDYKYVTFNGIDSIGQEVIFQYIEEQNSISSYFIQAKFTVDGYEDIAELTDIFLRNNGLK